MAARRAGKSRLLCGATFSGRLRRQKSGRIVGTIWYTPRTHVSSDSRALNFHLFCLSIQRPGVFRQLTPPNRGVRQRSTWPKSKLTVNTHFKQRSSLRQRFFPNITSSRSCPFLCEQGKSCVSKSTTSSTAASPPSQAPPAARDAAASCAHFVYMPPF